MRFLPHCISMSIDIVIFQVLVYVAIFRRESHGGLPSVLLALTIFPSPPP